MGGKSAETAYELDVSEARLPRRRKIPRHYNGGHAEAEFHQQEILPSDIQ